MIDYENDWTKKALEVSMSFEGHDPWANIVGNFDGAGLTCGALGWTIKWGNQQRLVKEFISLHGEAKAKLLMPTCWEAYWIIVSAKEAVAITSAGAWSEGRSIVKEPYNSELRAFWKSPEMIAIQTAFAWKDMGAFAKKKTEEGQLFFGLQQPKFGHFCYWFDQAVMNGTKTVIEFNQTASVKQVIDWCKSETGAGQADTRKNAKLWETSISQYDADEIQLWKMAYLRAVKARAEYDVTVMNRRGTLALGEGFVNGVLRKFEWVKLNT